jgi:hypothetical protein
VEYELDTCTTSFSNETPAGSALLAVWEYFDSTVQ